jgi:hypothetical protein
VAILLSATELISIDTIAKVLGVTTRAIFVDIEKFRSPDVCVKSWGGRRDNNLIKEQ